jgi:ABC-type transporter Mla maintaining outer membrane lipid asymmetry ATPase subunit MlaF
MLLDSMAVATHAAEHDAVFPAVVFDHVSFAFDDHVVLRDVSFTIPTGGMTMLLGASGSGKSVLEQVTSIVVTHQIRDAVYVATHQAIRTGDLTWIQAASDEKVGQAVSMVLHEGRIYFQGSAAQLHASRDEYLRQFLFMTLPPW